MDGITCAIIVCPVSPAYTVPSLNTYISSMVLKKPSLRLVHVSSWLWYMKRGSEPQVSEMEALSTVHISLPFLRFIGPKSSTTRDSCRMQSTAKGTN